MKKLFLSSYFREVFKLLPDFAGGCSGKKVVFIPTASLREKFTFYVKEDFKALQKLGLTVETLEISSAAYEESAVKISGADIIFVAGGNSFFLLQELKRTGTDKLILEHIGKGKVYVGSSAGSVIAAPDIEYVKFADPPEEAPGLNGNFSALSVVDFYVVPHATNFPFKKATAKTVEGFSKLDLRLVSNHQAIVVNGDKVETLDRRTS